MRHTTSDVNETSKFIMAQYSLFAFVQLGRKPFKFCMFNALHA